LAHLFDLKAQFYQTVYPSLPNEWEVDELFDNFAGVDEQWLQSLLDQVSVIWPVSHALCFDYLTAAPEALKSIGLELLEEWVRSILAVYEKQGLLAARKAMGNIDTYFLAPLRGEAGVNFEEVETWMHP
jgi:nitric oxide reductase NorD protein